MWILCVRWSTEKQQQWELLSQQTEQSAAPLCFTELFSELQLSVVLGPRRQLLIPAATERVAAWEVFVLDEALPVQYTPLPFVRLATRP